MKRNQQSGYFVLVQEHVRDSLPVLFCFIFGGGEGGGGKRKRGGEPVSRVAFTISAQSVGFCLSKRRRTQLYLRDWKPSS